MLRVIQQERDATTAWQAFLQGAAAKGETFADYQRRIGVRTHTPLDSDLAANETQATIAAVKRKLGSLYRAPITA